MNKLESVKGFLIDLDGTVYEGKRLIDGAKEAVVKIRSAGYPIRFVTNTTRKSRKDIIEDLSAIGMKITPEEIFTAPIAANNYLKERNISKAALYISEKTLTDFTEVEVINDSPEAVVIGDLGKGWNYDLLNECFRHILNGAEIIAIQKNRYWKTEEGLSLDAGAFIAGLEYATNKHAEIIGKPSRYFFDAAVKSMNLYIEDTAVIGDDIESDIRGAHNAGAMGILVKTGKFREVDLSREKFVAELIIDSIKELSEKLNI